MAGYIARRKFLATLGGTAAWPLAARAAGAQQSAVPVIGFLSARAAHARMSQVMRPFSAPLTNSANFFRV